MASRPRCLLREPAAVQCQAPAKHRPDGRRPRLIALTSCKTRCETHVFGAFSWSLRSRRMLALFLVIALLGTDSAYGRSTIDLTAANHDNTDLGGSELYAETTGNYGGDGDPFDFTEAKVETLDLTDLTATTDSTIGLRPSGPSPSATPASPVPPSPSIDGGLDHLADAPDGGFSSSIIDISGANHDNADLGGSELHLMTEAEMAANYGDMPDNFDLAADTVDTVDV
eukprot:scaffold112312_cov32-Phaeocystis_antarctica.AAC.1